jgi:hypothetical protein
MNFSWLSLENPVAMWWYFLVAVSSVNILGWVWTRIYFLKNPSTPSHTRHLIWFSALYVFGCAFRSVLPRADVQRICLYDTPLSSVLVGRSVATVAELSFVIQWAIVLHFLSQTTNSKMAERISQIIVPLIFIAECFSWYAVLTTHYMGNTFEESLWAVTYSLLAISLISLWPRFKGALKYAIGFTIVGSVLYVAFMAKVDVPMYLGRWREDSMNAKPILDISAGVKDLATRWVVTHNISDWHEEIPWMSLYFSVAVWTSLALCYVPMTKERLSKYLKNVG